MRQIEHHEFIPNDHHGREVVVILLGLKDPLNVGHAFRICSSLGIRSLYLCNDTPAPPSAKINRTARGAQHQVVWYTGDHKEVFDTLKKDGYKLIAVELATASEDLRTVLQDTDQRVALIVGNEAHGIATSQLAQCDVVAHIPLYGKMSSLNVATALSIAAWEAIR